MEGKQILAVVAISAATALVITGTVLYFGMRGPLPLIDTAQSRAVFEEQRATAPANQQQAA